MKINSIKHAVLVGGGTLLAIFLFTVMYYSKDRLLAMEQILLDSSISDLDPIKIERYSFIGSRVGFIYSTRNKTVGEIYDHYCRYFLNRPEWYEGIIDKPDSDELISCSDKNVDYRLFFCARDDNKEFRLHFRSKKGKRDLTVNVFTAQVVWRVDKNSMVCN